MQKEHIKHKAFKKVQPSWRKVEEEYFQPLSELRLKGDRFEMELWSQLPNVKATNLVLIKNLETNEFGEDVEREVSVVNLPGYANQAYFPTKNAIYITTGLPSLSHETAHMVEMNDYSRLLQGDWGLWSKRASPKGLVCAIARESRVRGIESHMSTYRNIDNLINSSGGVGLLCDMLKPSLPFGRFKDIAEVRQWAVSIFESTRSQWDLERIRHEWDLRADYIRNWQETKDD